MRIDVFTFGAVRPAPDLIAVPAACMVITQPRRSVSPRPVTL
jgi:hypothetical protein